MVQSFNDLFLSESGNINERNTEGLRQNEWGYEPEQPRFLKKFLFLFNAKANCFLRLLALKKSRGMNQPTDRFPFPLLFPYSHLLVSRNSNLCSSLTIDHQSLIKGPACERDRSIATQFSLDRHGRIAGSLHMSDRREHIGPLLPSYLVVRISLTDSDEFKI
jgi:hypothetical protein